MGKKLLFDAAGEDGDNPHTEHINNGKANTDMKTTWGTQRSPFVLFRFVRKELEVQNRDVY